MRKLYSYMCRLCAEKMKELYCLREIEDKEERWMVCPLCQNRGRLPVWEIVDEKE